MKIGMSMRFGQLNFIHPNIYLPTRYFRSRKAFTVAVEGNIGSGKTTFLNRFCPETDNVDVLAEPVDRDAFAMIKEYRYT